MILKKATSQNGLYWILKGTDDTLLPNKLKREIALIFITTTN